MSQESDGEWIVHLPDLCSYQEYIDTHVEPAQQFPDVHFVFDCMTLTRGRIFIPRPDQYPFRHTDIIEYERAKSKAIDEFGGSWHDQNMLESPDNASDFNSASSQAMKKFADFPSFRANISMLGRIAHSSGHISYRSTPDGLIRHEVHHRNCLNAQGEEKIDRPKARRLRWLGIAFIYTAIVFDLNQDVPRFLEPYILFLDWPLVLFYVILASCLTVCLLVRLGIFLGECTKYIWLAVWAGSIKYFNYLATRAVLIYGLGKQKVNHSKVRACQVIILLGKIAIPPTFYAAQLALRTYTKILQNGTSGARSPPGLVAIPLALSALALFPGIWLYGAYAYPYSHPYTFHKRIAHSNTNAAMAIPRDPHFDIQTNQDTGVTQTKKVTCLCAMYAEYGCDDYGAGDSWKVVWFNTTAQVTISIGDMLFFVSTIWFLYKSPNAGSSWKQRRQKRARNRRGEDLKSSRWASTMLIQPVETSQKTKRGLRGFANGHSTAGIADTGATHNVVSLTFAQSLGLDIRPSTHKFQLGSSKQIVSLGTVQFQWAFGDDSRNITTITCHVLGTCIYDLILGRRFLAETQTLSKYQHRLSQCVFSAPRSFKFGLLGETFRRMEGTLGSHEHVLALPDTGAERNVIDFHYAQKLNFVINRSAEARNYLQFADGSYKQMVGQIHTHWTFASGKRISITFEVLKNCASNVVIGEQVLYENKVFTEHLNDFRVLETEKKGSDLAPFDFLNRVEGALEKGKRILGKKKKIGTMPQFAMEENVRKQVEEQRREAWNDSADFRKNVDEVDRRLEKKRREMFEKRLLL